MMFNIKKLKRENERLEKKVFELESEILALRKSYKINREFLIYETAAHKAALKTIEEYKEELVKSKKEAADATSLYYDTIQKLKTVMEETGYGQNL